MYNMYSDNVKDLVSSVAVLITVLQFLSGVLVCRQFISNKTTAEASPLPFICGTLSCSFWLLYGLVKHDNKIILVNVIGLLLMSTYTYVFYLYTFKKNVVLKELCVMTFVMLLTIAYVYSEMNHEVLVRRLGLLACSLTLITILAPMSKLFHVIKTRSTECLPFPMILMSFFVSSLWFLYGSIVEDIFIQMPNFIGAVLAICQLSLFVIYPNTSDKSMLNKSLTP